MRVRKKKSEKERKKERKRVFKKRAIKKDSKMLQNKSEKDIKCERN